LPSEIGLRQKKGSETKRNYRKTAKILGELVVFVVQKRNKYCIYIKYISHLNLFHRKKQEKPKKKQEKHKKNHKKTPF